MTQRLGRSREFLKTQSEILGAMKRFLEEKDLSKNKFGVFALAKTLLKKSERHEEQGETVLTALCVYRALELLLQERLSLYNLTPETPLTEEQKDAMRREIAKVVQKPEDQVQIHDKLGLFELTVLLIVRNDECVRRVFDQNRLKTLPLALQSRNSSLLIHGFDFPSENQTRHIKKCAEELLKDLRVRAQVELGSNTDRYFEKLDPSFLKL